MNIWKIGAWPGTRKEGTKSNRKRILEIFLSRNFVALGFGWIGDFNKLSDDTLIRKIMECPTKTINKRETKKYKDQIRDFSKEVIKGDTIPLYCKNRSAIFGRSTGRYYYVPHGSKKDFIKGIAGINRAPHRIDVEWLFNKKVFEVDFSWNDTVHQVLREDLFRVKDKTLKSFLERELNNKINGGRH